MHRFAFLVLLLASVSAGCAASNAKRDSAPPPPARAATRNPTDDVLRDPAQLMAHGRAALEARDLDLAYRYYALVHLLHPTSDEDAEAFEWAAGIFKRRFEETRWNQTDSVWQTSEPIFLWQWLETSFFADAKKFPDKAMAALFRGTPFDFGSRFVAHAKTRPALAQWRYSIEDDNGRVVAITGEREKK